MGAPTGNREERRRLCKRVYLLKERRPELTQKEIGMLLGVPQPTVQYWLANPARWSPFYDEVALRRAMAGERSVFEALSYWEGIEFYRRLGEKRRAMYVSWWQEFTHELSVSLGVTADSLASAIDRWG